MRAKVVTAAACSLALGLAAAGPAGAIVPPRNCGTIEVKERRYTIKADQMRCRTAKRYSRRYLRSHERPSGYRCTDYGRETKLKFRCSRGIRVFFAIRR
jgi:hypothetical protein